MRHVLRWALIYAVLSVMVAKSLSQEPPAIIKIQSTELGRPIEFKVKLTGKSKLGWAKGWEGSAASAVRLYSEDPAAEADFQIQVFEPGKYVLLFWNEGNIRAKRTIIDAGLAIPIPPNPPGPNPPGPNPPPSPTDEVARLAGKFQEQYTADRSANKQIALQEFAALVKLAGEKTCFETSIDTVYRFSHVVSLARALNPKIGNDELVGIRGVMNGELSKAFGGDYNNPEINILPFDNANRQKMSALYGNFYQALLRVK